MERSSIKVASESDVTPAAEETLDFDDITLKAKAEVYKNEGNEEYKKKDFSNAIYFYTEGIKVNCKDEELKAKLYSNRAIAHFYLGNYNDSLSDAKVATDLQPSYIKAIVRGASACVQLNQFKEAITWCDKGLAIDKNNQKLLELRNRSIKEQKKLQDTDGEKDLVKSECDESDVSTPAAEETLDFDDDTLRAKAEIYKNDGNEEYKKKDFSNAIHFYTKGIKVNCKDEELKAKLYNNRATAHFYLGNYKDSLSDAKFAIDFQPSFVKAIVRGASACVQLKQFKEAITWCDKGLAIDKNNQKLLELRNRSIKEQSKLQDTDGEKKTCADVLDRAENISASGQHRYIYGHIPQDIKRDINYSEHFLKLAKQTGHWAVELGAYSYLGEMYSRLGDFKTAINYFEHSLKLAKQERDKAAEGGAYGNLGIVHRNLGDFKRAIDCHERCLKIAKELGDKYIEESAYGNLGNAHNSLGDFKTAKEYHERCLKIANELGDKSGEGKAYGNLGSAHDSLGDFKTAIDYHERDLKIAKQFGDKSGEGEAYGNLGIVYRNLGHFKTAIDYHERALKIAKELGDKSGEGYAYGNLGIVHRNLGDFKTAIDYHELDLKIAKELGDKSGEGSAYGNLGVVHRNLGDFKTAVDYHERDLKIAKELGDKWGEEYAYGNLGNDYQLLGDFKTAIDYYERHLKISKELGDKKGEESAYGNLGSAHANLGDLKTAIDCHELSLKIAKELGNSIGIAQSFFSLGVCFEYLGHAREAVDYYQCSVTTFNNIRDRLQFKDKWKIGLRNNYQKAYTCLWRLLLKQGKVMEALFSAEQGRAQALKDLMELNYAFETTDAGSRRKKETIHELLSCLPPNTIFLAFGEKEIVLWVCQKGKNIELRRKQISLRDDVITFLQSLVQIACQEIGARDDVKCEDRSFDMTRDKKPAAERSPTDNSRTQSLNHQKGALSTLYDTIIDPIQDLLLGSELIFVPEGPLCLAPFAALKGTKVLCESFRIRVIPSLTSLKLIADCPADYHSKSGELLVGDPWVQEVTKLEQLPCAREEVEMIGRMLGSRPLIGKQATKDEVLRRLGSVALVHIAAHGSMETGEIALAPKTGEVDYILTMRDVLRVQVRARLVVLSCCHSARGEIKAEGVVGIARAFLGAGARSVLVSLWAIDDEATLEFMKMFYQQLVKRKSASEALNQAMNIMRESGEFSAVKYWAPFVLIGDDVTLQFGGSE